MFLCCYWLYPVVVIISRMSNCLVNMNTLFNTILVLFWVWFWGSQSKAYKTYLCYWLYPALSIISRLSSCLVDGCLTQFSSRFPCYHCYHCCQRYHCYHLYHCYRFHQPRVKLSGRWLFYWPSSQWSMRLPDAIHQQLLLLCTFKCWLNFKNKRIPAQEINQHFYLILVKLSGRWLPDAIQP